MIGPREALERILAAVAPLPVEEIDLAAARGRVLAEEVRADRDVPPADRSAMDGYAVRAADLPEPGGVLPVAGEIPAGRPAEGIVLAPGTALRIFTGAVVPEGADAVVMVELAEEDADAGTVRIREAPQPGQHVRRRGEDRRAGEVVLGPGTPVGPPEIAALAAVGKVRLRAHRAPTAAVLSTGDEVVEASARPGPHQVRNSNSWALRAQLAEAGIEPVDLGIAGDDPGALRDRVARGLEHDLFLVTGGVSVGLYDLVTAALAGAGVETLVHGVAMRPGKPLLAGRGPRGLVLGLPGNPVSAFTAFLVFGAPALRRMAGHPHPGPEEVRVRLAAPLRRKPGRTTYHLAAVWPEGDGLAGREVASTGSGDVLSLAGANAFLVSEPGARSIPEGTVVPAIPWPGWPRRAGAPGAPRG